MGKTKKLYKQLSAEERAAIMLMKQEGSGLREMGRFLKRSHSTISRELARGLGVGSGYVASLAGEQASRLRLIVGQDHEQSQQKILNLNSNQSPLHKILSFRT